MDMELNPSPLTPSDFYSGSTEQTALGDESPASALAARAVWGPHCLPSGPQSSFLIARRPQLNPTPHPLRTLPSSTSMSTAPGQAQAAPTPTQGPLPSSRPHLVPTSLDPVMYLLSSLSAKRALRFPASWDQRGPRVAWRATWEGATWPCVISQLATSPKHHALQACQPSAHLLQPHSQEEGLCLPTAHSKPSPLGSPAQGAAVTDVCNTSVHELATPPVLESLTMSTGCIRPFALDKQNTTNSGRHL